MEPTADPTPEPAPAPSMVEQSMAARPWYLKPHTAIWLGPVLIVLCVAMRFGWGGIEGPPFPFWGIAYAIGAAGIFLTYTAFSERGKGYAESRAPRAIIAITVGITALLTVAAVPASARRVPFTITSPAFRAGGLIPDGFTCKGADASLPLRWRGVPKRTEQLALIMEDPDAPVGTFVHWVAWGIDPTKRRLPEETLPAGVVEGASGTGKPGYFGPCPPPADGAHRYRITTYALDAAPDVAAGATAADLRAAIKGHVLATAKLVGRYDS